MFSSIVLALPPSFCILFVLFVSSSSFVQEVPTTPYLPTARLEPIVCCCPLLSYSPRGPTDKASAYGAEDSEFESLRGCPD
eukprot:scaffold45749_cov60-Phaeocystis_antarctica.AAC.2